MFFLAVTLAVLVMAVLQFGLGYIYHRSKYGSRQYLQCEIEGHCLVLRIGLQTLKVASQGCPLFYDGELNSSYPYVEVVDVDELAKDISRAIMEEGEDGSSHVTYMLDYGINEAFEQGSLGFADGK